MRVKQPYTLIKEQLPPADVVYLNNAKTCHNTLCNPALMDELKASNPRAHMLLLIALGALRELCKALEVQL